MDRAPILTQNDSKLCRICLDNDNPKDFIHPCLCSGGSAYVHRKCLDNWRAMNKNGRAFEYCDVCQFKYVIEPVVDDLSADKKRLLIFRLLVTRDITLIIVLIQAVIIGMAFLIQVLDKGNHAIRNLYPASANSFGIYYLSSLILFLALLGFFGLIGLCCGLIKNDGVDDRCDCCCYQCFFLNMSCNDCGGNHNCGGGGDGASILVIILLIFVLIFAIIGVFFGIILSGMIIRKVVKHHTNKLWLTQETKKYVVKDFTERIDELKNISTQQPIRNPPRHSTIDNDRTPIKPSAPVELLSVTTLNVQ